MRQIAILSALMVAFTVGTAFAGQVGTLTTFTPNTPAHAESVNDNFTEVATQINDNDTRINQLGTSVSGNTSLISTNTSDIQTNQGNITTNSTNIGTNSTNIGSNTISIGSNATNISGNASAISGHETRIIDLEGHDHDTQYSDILHGHTPGDISGPINADTVDGQHSSEFAPVVHGHPFSEVSGVADAAQLPVGTGSSEVAAGDHTHSPPYGDADTLDSLDSSDFATTDQLTSYVQSSLMTTQIGYLSVRWLGDYASYNIRNFNIALPHGAVIEGFTYYFNDNDSAPNASCRIMRFDPTVNTAEQVATVESPAGFNAGLGSAYTSTIDYPYVDNMAYTYFVEFGNYSLSAVIEYSYTNY